MGNIYLGIAAFFMFLVAATSSHAVSWRTSCSVDSGSLIRGGGAYIFRTSKNHCPGGVYKQRSEIYTSNIAVTRKVSYIFHTTLSMKAAAKEEFIIFQIHDSRIGCSPPLSIRWMGNNTLRFDSDYTRGKGMSGCVQNRSLRSAKYTGSKLKRDGTSYHLQVRLAFDGDGGFAVDTFVNEQPVLSGIYRPSTDPSFIASKKFYMKHGVYSQNLFKYEMRSIGMRVSQGR